MKDVFNYSKGTITLDELERFYNLNDYKALCNKVEELESLGKIKAIKPKDINGKFPPLPKKYRITRPQEENDAYIKEMKSELPARFTLDFYKNNVAKYIEHRKYIMALGEYFKCQKKAFKQEMSINERSFDIWQEEKFLKDNPIAITMLNNLGLSLEDLNVYKTPEPFFCYSKTREPGQNILIVENKDTWYSVRKLMRQGQIQFFDVIFGTVIYGEGKKILSSFSEIEEHGEEEAYLGDKENVFYYFGDLDFEGLSIYGQLKSKFQRLRNICLLKPAYLKMISAANTETLKYMKQEQIKKGSNEFSGWRKVLEEFTLETQKNITAIFEEGKYIPQEIVNFQLLKEGE